MSAPTKAQLYAESIDPPDDDEIDEFGWPQWDSYEDYERELAAEYSDDDIPSRLHEKNPDNAIVIRRIEGFEELYADSGDPKTLTAKQ